MFTEGNGLSNFMPGEEIVGKTSPLQNFHFMMNWKAKDCLEEKVLEIRQIS